MRDSPVPARSPVSQEAVIGVRGLEAGFGDRRVLRGIDLDLYRGEILGVVGASGSGKSVLLRTLLGLMPKRAGNIEIVGANVEDMPFEARHQREQRLGVLFQFGALTSSITVKENVQLMMREHLQLSEELLEEVAILELEMVGLARDTGEKYPSELSGGMVKRAALARALALDPEIVFLDEPTPGLDPIGADEFDELIKTLRGTLGLTVLMVTHDLDSLHAICDRIAAIDQGRIIASGSFETMLDSQDSWLRSYFHGKRARAVTSAPQTDQRGEKEPARAVDAGEIRNALTCDRMRDGAILPAPTSMPARLPQLRVDHLQYLPVAPLFFAALVGLFALLLIFIQLRILQYAYARLGVSSGTALFLLFGSLLGSYVNIPVAQLPAQDVLVGREVSYFGMRYVAPVLVDWPGTIIAVNLGGALLPALLSVYLLTKNRLWPLGLLATGCVAVVCHLFAYPVPGVGIAVPIWAPPLAAAISALAISMRHAAPIAYAGGSLGTLIGADLLNLGAIRELGAPVASIGGAGTFDSIFLTGIIAVLIASWAGGEGS